MLEGDIDALFFPGAHTDRALLVCGRSGAFAELSPFRRESEIAIQIDFLLNIGASLLFFNPPEMGHSKGEPSEKTLSETVSSAYDYLIETRKIDPSHILLYGSCFGACYGILGAALIQEKYPNRPLSIVADRSFASLSDLAGKLLKNPFSSFFAKKLLPNMNAKEGLNKLKGQKLLLYHRFDTQIPFPSSLYRAALKEPIPHTTAFELCDSTWNPTISYHRRPFTIEEGKLLLEFCKKMIDLPYDPSCIGAQFEVVKK